MNASTKYNIVETPCYPRKWKIVECATFYDGTWHDTTWVNGNDGHDNASWRYHYSIEEAMDAIIDEGGDFGEVIHLKKQAIIGEKL